MKQAKNQKQIYSAITKLALELSKKGEIYTRQDVAFYLKDYGIKSDSLFIELLIIRTYRNTSIKKEKNAIKKVFYTNQLNKKIIDEKNIFDIIQNETFDKAIQVLDSKTKKANRDLSKFEKQLADVHTKAQDFVVSKKFKSILSGSFQIDKVRVEAESFYEAYVQLVNKYEDAKESTNELIEDYTFLRHEVLKIYRENVLKLTEIFGDSIKAVEPKLFDYNSIEWLDTGSMLDDVQLEFDRIISTCSEVIGILNKQFLEGLSDSTKNFNNVDRRLAIAQLGLNFAASWIESKSKATAIRKDLEKLKSKMNNDITTIKGDIVRLKSIDKILKDKYIPITDIFSKHSKKIISTELTCLIDNLYKDPKIKKIKDEKDEVLDECNLIELEKLDHLNQIKYYTELVKEYRIQLKEIKPNYEEAKVKMPLKPFWLYNFLSFGYLNKNYNRDASEWNKIYRPFIDIYNELSENIRLDNKELSSHKKSLSSKESKLSTLQGKIKTYSEEIRIALQSNDELQSQIVKHIVPLINLLRAARKIVELTLDERFIKTVKIEKIEFDVIPPELKENLTEFISFVKGKSNKSIEKINIYKELNSESKEPSKSNQESNVTSLKSKNIHTLDEDETNKLLQKATSKLLNNTFELVENLVELEELKINNEIALQEYENQLNKLKTSFNLSFANQKEKAELMKKLIEKVKNGNSLKTKQAFLNLVDNEPNDWINEHQLIKAFKDNDDIVI